MENIWRVIEGVIEMSVHRFSGFVRSNAPSKGALFLTYRDIAHVMSKQHAFVFVTADELRSNVPSFAQEMVETNNHQTHFVVIVTVGVSKAAKRRDDDDALMKVYQISLAESEIDQSPAIQKSDPTANAILRGNCCRNCKNIAIGMKKCALCSCVRYCCKKCQTEDWPSHKAACIFLKQAKQHGSLELKEHKKVDDLSVPQTRC